MPRYCVALIASALALLGCDMAPSTPPPVTLAVVNAKVWTGDVRRPWAEAVAVCGENIAAVGLGSEVRKMLDSGTRVVDARGGMVVPGFIDAQIHGAAWAEFAEKRKGTLEPGKLADFVILDRDLTQVPPETIRDAQVVMTVVGGTIVYSR